MSETELQVRADADPDCNICKGRGWHWGWDSQNEPVMLRCPCVDQNRASPAPPDAGKDAPR